MPTLLTETYLRCCSWVSRDSLVIVVSDSDEDVMAVDDIECEHDRVLHLPQVGQDIDVECPSYCRNAH